MNTYSEIQELCVEKLVWRGRGLARQASGKIVMIEPGVLPGEAVKARIIKDKKDYAEAALVEVLDPSPRRRPHPCRAAQLCGGCRFGIVPWADQVEIKKSLVLEALARGLRDRYDPGWADRLEELVGARSWFYRIRAQVHVKNGRPHYRELGGPGLVPADKCMLWTLGLRKEMSRLCRDLPDGRHVVGAAPESGQARWEGDPEPLVLPVPGYGVNLMVPAGCFFQANWGLNQALIHRVCAALRDCPRVADLYCGAGNFALPLAGCGPRVLALDFDERAVSAGSEAAAGQNLPGVKFAVADLSDPAAVDMVAGFAPQGLVIDPPRSGGGRVVSRLADVSDLKRMVWVSCDVVNTCRDLRIFLESGWEIRDLVMADMFPHTWHCEVVLVLDRA